MAINMSSKNYIDNVLEITAFKSKLLLTENNIITLSNKHEGLEYLVELINSPNKSLRFRYDEIDSDIVTLRKIIGNLPDYRDAETYMIQEIKTRMIDKTSFEEIEKVQNVINQLISEGNINEPIRIIELSSRQNINPHYVIENLLILGEMQNRSSLEKNNYSLNKNWDGIKPLSDLFEKEISPKSRSIYFDQEFINYLKENTSDLDRIHWRNFERLIAEFFNKIGYYINLGPGSNDGGIDIKIYDTEQKEVGPPLIIIQCKRYREDNTVDINAVKAFYADLLDSQADRGLIATTSRVATGGKKVIQARNYKINVAESQDVKKMILNMWSKHYNC